MNDSPSLPSLPPSLPPFLLAAVDPNSGTAAQLEVAKGLGALLQTGWKPRRTIILASWSGEELGLIGSTAWGEKHARELDAKAVLYVNVDSAVSGPFFQAGATPSMKTLLEKLQEDVRHPYDGQPIARNWTADGGINILGSGSDYTVFLDHLGGWVGIWGGQEGCVLMDCMLLCSCLISYSSILWGEF